MFPSTPTPPSGGSQPPVVDRTTKPAGLLPKHLQTWVVLGIAVLMTGIIAISGSTHPIERKPAVDPVLTATQPNDGRIQEYRKRVNDEAQRVAAAQAELEVAKRALQSPGPIADREPVETRAVARDDDRSIDREKAQREYRALFADNVALTLRPREQGGASTAPPASSAPAASNEHRETSRPQQATVNTGADPKPKFTVREGTIIEAVLTNRLDGSFAGPVNAMVTTDVYASDREHVLIPQGSRLLGEAKSVSSFGQQRLAVAFHRVLLPNGDAASLDQFTGLNQAGETGLKDQVNHHYAQLFGVSLAIGAIGGLAQADTRVGLDATGGDLYRQGVASSTAQSSMHILDRFLNILPTVTIREGQRLKVYLSGDLNLPAYGDGYE